MSKRPVLVSAIFLTIIVEVILIILLYNQVGAERLPPQITRLTFQLVLIAWVLNSESNTGLFLLTTYHIISGLLGMYSKGSTELFGQVLIGFHFIIGLVIYFHDRIENKIGIKV